MGQARGERRGIVGRRTTTRDDEKGSRSNGRARSREMLGRWMRLLAALLEVNGEPLETLVEAVTRGSTSGLDVPLALAERVEAELVGDVGRVHGVGQVLWGCQCCSCSAKKTSCAGCARSGPSCDVPACWRRPGEGRHGARLRSTCAGLWSTISKCEHLKS